MTEIGVSHEYPGFYRTYKELKPAMSRYYGREE